jgi:2-polyprenyl-3-methyl-5-hydroxy-6-metoxy-1,4-benzoquinol methylase
MTPDYAALYRGDYMADRWAYRASAMPDIPIGHRVLEIGAGRGQLADRMRSTGHDWTPCDPWPPSHLMARAELPYLPWMANAFDVCVAVDVMEHLPPWNVAPSIRDMQRVAPRAVCSIATMSDVHHIAGIPTELHLTIRPMEWWALAFTSAGAAVHAERIDCDRFWIDAVWP